MCEGAVGSALRTCGGRGAAAFGDVDEEILNASRWSLLPSLSVSTTPAR